jgi:putative transposase
MTNPHHPHHRRSIRVQGYDYTHQGAYFLTLCSHERLEILGAIVDHEMKLSLPGKIAQQELLRLAKRFPHIRLGEFVVMPNHVHAVIFIVDHENHAPTEEAFGQPVHGSIPTIVRSYKASVNWQVNRLRDAPAHRLVRKPASSGSAIITSISSETSATCAASAHTSRPTP